jgi:hypothetical protein
MADLGHEPPINPPDVYAPQESIDCPHCDQPLELGHDIDPSGGECPHCRMDVDEDAIRDHLEARNEPEEDWGSDR